jgi:alkylhydroperoxidase/carboxymuconolactone decarboxylase family protein YurZ
MGDSVPHLQLHVHAAHKAGASPEEILEVFALLQSLLGALRVMPGLDAWRATFRPEVPPIQRVAELR